MVTAWSEKQDPELLEAIQSGSHHAFAVLVTRHTPRFYRIAYRYMAQREAAEDIVQQAFLKLWARPDHWQAGRQASFTTWFTRVIIHLCLDAKRKRATLPLEEGMDPEDSAPLPEEALLRCEEQTALETAIQALPERQQTALALCFYEAVSNQEAASVMQISVKALESLLMRAKMTLKIRLNPPQRDDYSRKRA